jgi:hypothetical protein
MIAGEFIRRVGPFHDALATILRRERLESG